MKKKLKLVIIIFVLTQWCSYYTVEVWKTWWCKNGIKRSVHGDVAYKDMNKVPKSVFHLRH